MGWLAYSTGPRWSPLCQASGYGSHSMQPLGANQIPTPTRCAYCQDLCYWNYRHQSWDAQPYPVIPEEPYWWEL